MTLYELLPAVRQLPANEKLKLIRILAEDLDSNDEIFPFEPDKIYYLHTPYNSFGVAEVLAQGLGEIESDENL
jgi:hypothetical protein